MHGLWGILYVYTFSTGWCVCVDCPAGWTVGFDSCYFFHEVSLTWWEASVCNNNETEHVVSTLDILFRQISLNQAAINSIELILKLRPIWKLLKKTKYVFCSILKKYFLLT